MNTWEIYISHFFIEVKQCDTLYVSIAGVAQREQNRTKQVLNRMYAHFAVGRFATLMTSLLGRRSECTRIAYGKTLRKSYGAETMTRIIEVIVIVVLPMLIGYHLNPGKTIVKYVDKPVYRDKLVYVDKPVEKIVYRDREKIVYRDRPARRLAYLGYHDSRSISQRFKLDYATADRYMRGGRYHIYLTIE
jgi:hypothetical protein